MALDQLACLGWFLMMGAVGGVLFVANRRMIAQYRVYARKFGLTVNARKVLGLYRYPSVHGEWSGRRIRVTSGRRPGVTRRRRSQTTTKLHMSGQPALAFRLERRTSRRSGLDDEAFLAHFAIEDASPAAVLATLDERTRQELIEFARGAVTSSPDGLRFFMQQQMLTGHAARVRFEVLTEAFLRWVPALETARPHPPVGPEPAGHPPR